jgi:hypothetical protein
VADLVKATAGRVGKPRRERVTTALRVALMIGVMAGGVAGALVFMWGNFSGILLSGHDGRPSPVHAAGYVGAVGFLVAAAPLLVGALRTPRGAKVIGQAGGRVQRWPGAGGAES